MSQPLTAERFEQFVELFTEKHGETTAHLDKIDDTLKDHTERLERIERLLWHGQRLEEIEHRVRQLAERTGNADLATPLPQPLISR